MKFETYSIEEASQVLKQSRKTLYNWVCIGKIKIKRHFYKTGRNLLFTEAQLKNIMEDLSNQYV
jgi:excisionase family DNA binding protein